MAYSDYGGYAYRNGKLALDGCDVSLPDNSGMIHVLLGDESLRLGLYKQLGGALYWKNRKVGKVYYDIWGNCFCSGVDGYTEWDTVEEGDSLTLGVYRIVMHHTEITVCYVDSDNYYQYAQLRQPNGTIWAGFSGYGVGAGFENGGYASTDDCIARLKSEFPESFK